MPHCLGAVGSGPPAIHCLTAWWQWAVDLLQYTAPLPRGRGQWTSCNTMHHCLGAVGSGPPAIHCLTAWGQWAADLLQYNASLPGGSGQWTSCNTLPHCLGAVGSGPPAIHCLTATELATQHGIVTRCGAPNDRAWAPACGRGANGVEHKP